MGSDNKAIFVIGVSGTGKTTIADALANHLKGKFIDADDYHSAQNKASMANGIPLTDEMRKGWLQDVCAATNAQGSITVVACSALKKAYRDTIRSRIKDASFVFLDVDPNILAQRIARRAQHFVPVSLLESQLQTLQVPQSDETDVLWVDGTLAVSTIVELAGRRFGK